MKKFFLILLYFFTVFVNCEEFSIFFTGDSHGGVIPEVIRKDLYTKSLKKSGGAAYISDLYRKNAEIYKNNILISCGDIFDGSYVTDSFDGKPQIEWMNKVKYSIFTPGNHDFKFSVNTLKKYCSESNFITLNTNVVDSNSYLNVFEESYILDINGVKIGFLAFLTREGGYNKEIIKKGNINIVDPFQIASHYVEKLKEKKVDYIIFINHMGLEKDKIMAKKFSPDIIIGGHSHSVLKNPVKSGDTLIFHAGAYLQYLGHVLFDIKDNKIEFKDYKLLSVNSDVADEDPEIAGIIEKYHSQVRDYINTQITVVKKEMKKSSDTLYYFLTDNVRKITKSDICVINKSSIRNGIKAGNVTFRDIYKVFPWEDKAVMFSAKGNVILSERLLVKENISRDKTYKVVTNSYVFERLKDKYNLQNIIVSEKSFRELIIENLLKEN